MCKITHYFRHDQPFSINSLSEEVIEDYSILYHAAMRIATYRLIPAVYLEDVFAECHLTKVDGVVVTVNDQVYLCLCRPPRIGMGEYSTDA